MEKGSWAFAPSLALGLNSPTRTYLYYLHVEQDNLPDGGGTASFVAITPAADADGRDRYVDWYYAYKTGETGEGVSFGGPPYWGKYVYHDNNRDINLSQVSMRALADWYFTAYPPIMHDLHESLPLLYTYSGAAPQNPNLDPILFTELPFFANFELAQMTKYGMPGVYTHGFMDGWSPGYLGSVAYNHNGMMRMYETQSGSEGRGGRGAGAAAQADGAPGRDPLGGALRRAACLVRRFARSRVVQGGIDLEDIVQETLLAVHLKRHTWRSSDPILPWFMSITRYKIVDACRRQRIRISVPIDDLADVTLTAAGPNSMGGAVRSKVAA